MKLEGFAYDVQARVMLTRAELDALIKLSGYHYDAICVEAGLCIGQQHPKVGAAGHNGFLAMLAMHDGEELRAIWPFAHFDLSLKILEQRALANGGVKERLLLDGLSAKFSATCTAIQKEHARLTKEAKK